MSQLPVVNERSTIFPVIAFIDEEGVPTTPNSAYWILTDAKGNVVNSRDHEDITSLDDTVTLTLSGEDTALSSGGEGRERYLSVYALYNSTLGNDLPLNGMFRFRIEAMVGE